MGFGTKQQRTFFKIKEGKIVITDKDKNETLYDFFEGKLKSIKYADRNVNFKGVDSIVKSYDITFNDNGKEYCWSPNYDSSLYSGFINAIASLDDFSQKIYIRPYLNKDKTRTNLYIEVNGNRLDWKYSIAEMPKIVPLIDKKGREIKNAQGNTIYDLEERLEWVKKVTTDVVAKLEQHKVNDNYDDEVETEVGTSDDIPF